MSELVLTGLDGKNPLGFLAALGVLNAASDRAQDEKTPPRLKWLLEGAFWPVLVGGPERGALLDLLCEDLKSLREHEALLGLRYRKGREHDAHDLKPPPEFYAEYLRSLVETGTDGSPSKRLGLSFAAAFATDVAVDNNGNTKPTALHFTAGQQEFLAMVMTLLKETTMGDLEEALFGPWQYTRPLPVLQWDNTAARDYAFRAGDPSKEKKLGVPGADVLAFRGLPFIGVAPVQDHRRERIDTTGCRGGWKSGVFRWPLWERPLSRPVIRSLLASKEIVDADPRILRARGVPVVLEADIRRSDQGGYGSFAPARVAEPDKDKQMAR